MTINFRFKRALILILAMLFLFAFKKQTVSINENNRVDNILIYVKNGYYTINDNGKEYTMYKCYMDDVIGITDYTHLQNGIYFKKNEIIFIVFSDYTTKNNYLYRIYRKGNKLQFDKIDESKLAINLLYIHNELLYYKIGGSYRSWRPDDSHIIKTASIDGKISVVCQDVEGTFVNYACEIDTAIIKKDRYTVFGYKNNENIDIERDVNNGILLITPYGCYYNSNTKNGIYYFNGENKLLISGKKAYDILHSNDYKKIYIITNEENNQFNLYLYENNRCSLIKENMERNQLGDRYSPKLIYNTNRLFYGDKEVRIKTYLKTNDVQIFDRSTETYGDIIIKDYFSKYTSSLYNDLNNNLYIYEYDDTGNNPSLYKIINVNEKELITNDFDGFYKLLKYEDNDENLFYLPELDKNYKISKVETVSNVPLIYNVPYEEPNHNVNILHSKNYYMPYIVSKKVDDKGEKKYVEYIAFDINGEFRESKIVYNNRYYDNVPLRFDPVYDKYYYCSSINKDRKKWIFDIYEIVVDKNKISEKIICSVERNIEEKESIFNYVGTLSNYKLFISDMGILYALDKGNLLKIGSGRIKEKHIVLNPYEKQLYYLNSKKDLMVIDENLNEIEIAKNVIEFIVLKNEVIYTTDNREYEVYKYSDKNSYLLMKGRAQLK